jgi:hypothetical protein
MVEVDNPAMIVVLCCQRPDGEIHHVMRCGSPLNFEVGNFPGELDAGKSTINRDGGVSGLIDFKMYDLPTLCS